MRNPRLFLALAIVLIGFCCPSLATTEYVIANNGNHISNSATLYKLNTKTGKLAKTGVLHTGGQGDMYEDNLSMVEVAVTRDASCIFVMDDGSSDIAAFSKATGYKRVGRYFNANLIAGANGSSLSLTPDGKFLYGSYSDTENVGAWAVGPTCTLVFLSAYGIGGFPDQIRTTPNGKYVLASGSPFSWQFGINGDGTLRSLNYLQFNEDACSRVTFCIPDGLDITKDGKFVVFASNAVDITRQHGVPVALTARITPSGLVNPRVWVLKNSPGLYEAEFPFFSAAGYAGSGALYLGVSGSGPTGVLTVSFQEKPMKFTVTNTTIVNPGQVGNIAVTGNTMVIAQYPNQIGVFRIKKDGSLTLLSTTTIDDQGEGLFSLSIFPSTR